MKINDKTKKIPRVFAYTVYCLSGHKPIVLKIKT